MNKYRLFDEKLCYTAGIFKSQLLFFRVLLFNSSYPIHYSLARGQDSVITCHLYTRCMGAYLHSTMLCGIIKTIACFEPLSSLGYVAVRSIFIRNGKEGYMTTRQIQFKQVN